MKPFTNDINGIRMSKNILDYVDFCFLLWKTNKTKNNILKIMIFKFFLIF